MPIVAADCFYYRAMLHRTRLCHSKSSVRLSLTFKCVFHIGSNSSKIISRLIIPIKVLARADPMQQRRSGPTGTPPQFGWNRGPISIFVKSNKSRPILSAAKSRLITFLRVQYILTFKGEYFIPSRVKIFPLDVCRQRMSLVRQQ